MFDHGPNQCMLTLLVEMKEGNPCVNESWKGGMALRAGWEV